jgi:hypothetical protein
MRFEKKVLNLLQMINDYDGKNIYDLLKIAYDFSNSWEIMTHC